MSGWSKGRGLWMWTNLVLPYRISIWGRACSYSIYNWRTHTHTHTFHSGCWNHSLTISPAYDPWQRTRRSQQNAQPHQIISRRLLKVYTRLFLNRACAVYYGLSSIPSWNGDAMAEGTEKFLAEFHGVRHKKQDGVLFLTSVRFAWDSGNGLQVNHPYSQVKGGQVNMHINS